MVGDEVLKLSVEAEDGGELRVAEPHRASCYGIEYRLDVGRRAGDHSQHFAGRGLLLQRLARLVDEPRILHRDYRLGSEILEQRNFLVGEWLGFASSYRDRPEQRIVFA